MANDKTDETDLVDTRQLPDEDVTEARRTKVGAESVAEEEESATDQDSEEPFVMQMASSQPGQATVASMRERLAAFIIDVGVLWMLFWSALFVFHKVTTHHWIGPVPTVGTVALFFHGVMLTLAFLYFFLLEAAFFATIGKFCCWMYVRRKDGRHAGALAIFIRNFFRLVEMASSWILTWVPMELTKRHQRLGDMAAGTIVIKKHAANAHFYPLDAERLASAFGRQLALGLDFILVAIWVVGYVFLIDYQSTILSQWLVIAFPVVSILFWTLVQFVLESTPGLWLFGYTITHEDGSRVSFASALLRVIAAPIDLVIGLPCMLLSLRKQKVGDMLAATVVSRQRRRWKGAIGSLIVAAISVGLVALGLFVNPINNVFRAGREFKLSFMPLVEGLPGWESTVEMQPSVLTIQNFRFGVNDPNTRRTPPVYDAGETVYLLFEIYGYVRKDRMMWIQEDLMVQYPDGSIGLKQENVVDYHQIVKPGNAPIELTNNIALPANAAPGTYVVTVTLRDVLAGNFVAKDTQSFTVKPPMPTVSPLEALPPPPPPAPSPLPTDRYATPAPGVDGASLPPPPPAGATTVPSSPIPVMPPPQGAVPPPPPGAMPPATPPSTGFTVLPGPSIAPKEETPMPVPPPPPPPPAPIKALTPVDQYGSKSVTPPVDAYAKPTTTITTTTTTTTTAPVPPRVTPPPAPVVIPVPVVVPPPPPPPAAAPMVEKQVAPITEKTLPAEKPAPTKPPVDVYAKPIVKPVPATAAPKAAAPVKSTPPTVAPKVAPVKTAPAAKPATPPAPKAAAPAKPAPTSPKTEVQKAAEQELKQVSKPASEIPSAESVKQTPPAPKKKKKPAGGSSGGDIIIP